MDPLKLAFSPGNTQVLSSGQGSATPTEGDLGAARFWGRGGLIDPGGGLYGREVRNFQEFSGAPPKSGWWGRSRKKIPLQRVPAWQGFG